MCEYPGAPCGISSSSKWDILGSLVHPTGVSRPTMNIPGNLRRMMILAGII
jgi:hypothetical protein